jgi:hypothetical protein
MYGAYSNPCETTDFMYPMLADVYYSVISQSEYGKATKDWIFDRTITCNAQSITKRVQEEISPNVFLQADGKLIARTKLDIRTSSNNENYSTTNILITNVRLPGDNIVYIETAGVRKGKATVFEVATLEPFVGGLQSIEYYFMMWRRSENQTVNEQ